MKRTSTVHPFGQSQYEPLRLQRTVFRIFGYYPGDSGFLHWSMIGVFVFHFWSQAQLCYWEFQHFWANITDGDIFVALIVITPSLTRFGVLLKCTFLFVKRKRLKQLLDKLINLYDQAKPDEKSIYQSVAYWSQKFTKFELIFFLATCVFFTTIPLGLMLYQAIWSPNEPRLFLLPTHVNQFRVVQHQLELLDQEVSSKPEYSDEPASENSRVLHQLKLIADRHGQAIEIAHVMSSLFVPNVFTCYTIAAIKLGLTCLIILEAKIFVKLIFIFGSLGIVTEIFVYSYGGSKLMEESQNVGRSAYHFPWYRYDKNVRKLVQLMMIRAQRPSRVEIPFFEATIATFGMIIRTAGSYMTLVQSLVELMPKTSSVHPFRQSRYEPLQSQRRAFRIFGYYPGDSGFLHWSLVGVFLFHYWSQVQLCYWEFRHGWAKIREGEVFVALEVMTPTLSRVGALLKCSVLIVGRKRLKKFLDKLVELHDQADENEKPIYKWVTYWSRQFTNFEQNFFLVTCLFFSLFPLGVMLFNSIMNPNNPRIFLLPTQVTLPYEYKYSPMFELTFLLMSYITFTPCFMLGGSDGLFIGVSLLVSSQFRLVQQQLENLEVEESLSEDVPAENKRILKQLKQIVQRHNQAIEMSQEMSSLFVPNVFTCYTIAAVKLGMACLIMSKADILVRIIFLFGSLGILTEIYIYSFGGTLLMEESENVCHRAYNFSWYRYDREVRQLIQMMMVRAQRPCRVEIPFFEASVVTFGAIIRTAGSYMTIMQSFVEN
ncbi:uncharacterized protein LOC6045479 isoform X3 [Culex quinquefasciatus]|uniref:uncharacterized protein LOC6045479 isoform X3 n=1 Tax=Culex quinquefasciatus TaxID=7176 RepID=UPI0018E2A4B0|nr:uncharacterized protein LOC6045479 isoform X3 [Culex quinquefasciatus]